MRSATTSMLIFGSKLLMGAKRVSSPKGFKKGAWGGCARVALEASSAHRKTSEADNADNDRTRDAMSCSLSRCTRQGGLHLDSIQWTVLRSSCKELRRSGLRPAA